MTVSANIKTFQDILTDGSSVVPSLPEEEVRRIVVETLLAYFEQAIRVDTVVQVVELIKRHKKTRFSDEIERELDQIRSIGFVNDLLTDSLQVLTAATRRGRDT